jgi:hypothetical protein
MTPAYHRVECLQVGAPTTKVGSFAQAFMPLRLPWRINPILFRIWAKRLVGLSSASASWVRSKKSKPPRILMPSKVSDRLRGRGIRILNALEISDFKF